MNAIDTIIFVPQKTVGKNPWLLETISSHVCLDVFEENALDERIHFWQKTSQATKQFIFEVLTIPETSPEFQLLYKTLQQHNVPYSKFYQLLKSRYETGIILWNNAFDYAKAIPVLSSKHVLYQVVPLYSDLLQVLGYNNLIRAAYDPTNIGIATRKKLLSTQQYTIYN